ncbi:MAG: OadG family protein [Eubacterium sp.]|nr:OadG family protein [Eubacterium sp.]
MKRKIKLWLLPLLVVCMLVSITGCGKEKSLNFEVNEAIMQQYTESIIEQYRDTSDVEQDYYLNGEDELAKSAVSGFLAAQTTDNVGNFLKLADGEGSVTFSNGADGKVLCSRILDYDRRDVKVTVSFSPNRKYEIDKNDFYNYISEEAANNGMDAATYVMQGIAPYVEADSGVDFSTMDSFLDSYLALNGNYPYIAEECEVSAVYSKSELMSQAGKNTAIGMAVVFCVLIFISFVISLLKYLPLLFDADIRKQNAEKKKKQEEEKTRTEQMIIGNSEKASASAAPAVSAPAKSSADDENLINDAELVAVITAAIYAATGSQVRGPAYTFSNDKLVVRSIRRARK